MEQDEMIRLSPGRDKLCALVNTVMNLGVQLGNYQIPIKNSERWR
jgi:hypothetical protein